MLSSKKRRFDERRFDKRRREPGQFHTVSRELLVSHVFIALSSYAVKLFVDILSQYTGFNNGDQCLAWTVMKKRGWKSKSTLDKARKELMAVELIEVSRYGSRRRPHLYALSIYAVDECNGKLEMKQTTVPSSAWRRHEPRVPLKIVSSAPPAVSYIRVMSHVTGNRRLAG